MLWGHRNDPVNFHRCLQDFDRRLPDLLDALREQDLLIITSDHGCDPTTPSTDHSREHALLLAYVEGRNAAGQIHEGGEFADVGATVNAWLGGKAPGAEHPGPADRRPVRLNDPELVRQQYETEAGLAVRRGAVARFREGPDAVDAALLAAVEAPAPRRVLEVGCGMGQFAERMLAELDLDLVAVDQSPRMVELARERGVDARVGDAQELPSTTASSIAWSRTGCSTTSHDLDLALAEFARVLVPGGRLVAATIGEQHMHERLEPRRLRPPAAAVLEGERRGGAAPALRPGRAG